MLLSDLFVPDAATPHEQFAPLLSQIPAAGAPRLSSSQMASPALVHRARALASLEASIFQLHLDLAFDGPVEAASGRKSNRRPPGLPIQEPAAPACDTRPVYECPFCTEFEQDGLSIFATMLGERLRSRVVYEDDHFVVMPPLGQFLEGGLLLLTREHVLSFANLPPAQFGHLERLLCAISKALLQRWGVAPVVFEHGPAPQWGKGVCCVDHAHLNIFPARVRLHPHLSARMHLPLGSVADLAKLQCAEFGYLFAQENDGERHAYDGHNVPTQLVRRIITSQLGIAGRWHWRDYLGHEELIATYRALKGQIRL
jgi:diadenosine tetraphosphate (Ap4A) HIT family hydrolase